ncbi:dUTP diphosphatase [Candidatus Nomurabacteria bacterium]|nr:dUTP diphosphatase [Candidatus Nomurabacteria bacterium]MCB9820533.1 dUTP diphosphatase [Candidatus Nomurabacteria bacterium]
MQLKVKKLYEDSKLPVKGHPGDAGMDFFTREKVVLAPGEQKRILTGVAVEIPEGYVGLIWDKSSISFNQGLTNLGGVIDSSYRGEIMVSLLNTSNKEQVIEKDHKVAQMVVQKFLDCEIVEVDSLSETIRGEGREGSTGKK